MSDNSKNSEIKHKTSRRESPRNQSVWQKPILSFIGKLKLNVQGASGQLGDPGTGGVGKRPA